MRRPQFLIIGAMKAGTTTLHRDLQRFPEIFLSDPKEPNDLVSDNVFTEKGLRAYTGLFDAAGPSQICGEASTTYTREPRHSGAAARALKVCGPDLKIIYVVRDPFDRAVSHYRYAFLRGRTTKLPQVDLFENPEYRDVSDYGAQLAPWRQAFGDEAILIVNFKDYVRARSETVGKVARHLGLEPMELDLDETTRFNASDEVKVSRGNVEKLISSAFFQRAVKPLLGDGLRRLGKAALLSRGREPPPVPTDPELRARFLAELSPLALEIAGVRSAARLSDLNLHHLPSMFALETSSNG